MTNETQLNDQILKSWNELGLSDELLSLIRKAGFETPTPVQSQSIPAALSGSDLVVSAQTGTGKTAAFVFPILEKLKRREGTYALILSPTREIAMQTQEALKIFGEPLGVRSVALIGGVDMRVDDQALKGYPQVLVATPGRLCDHLERGNIWLEYIEILVLDEADRMLDMGFSEPVARILQEIQKSRQTLLFSATFPPSVDKLARKILTNPVRIQIGKSVSPSATVDQKFIFTDEQSKLRELQKLLREEPGTIFVFTRSKISASRLWRSLQSRGFRDIVQMHSDLKQSDRVQALEDFKRGLCRVMIATDVVGRGIHVDGVAHVINYDLPRDAADYVHRIGRTGRADQVGKATTFITAKDEHIIPEIEKLVGYPIRRDSRRRH